jgi:hypothetical protein
MRQSDCRSPTSACVQCVRYLRNPVRRSLQKIVEQTWVAWRSVERPSYLFRSANEFLVLLPYVLVNFCKILYVRFRCYAVGKCEVCWKVWAVKATIYVGRGGGGGAKITFLPVVLHVCRIWIRFGKGDVQKPVLGDSAFRENRSFHLVPRSAHAWKYTPPFPPEAFTAWVDFTFFVLPTEAQAHRIACTHAHKHSKAKIRIPAGWMFSLRKESNIQIEISTKWHKM